MCMKPTAYYHCMQIFIADDGTFVARFQDDVWRIVLNMVDCGHVCQQPVFLFRMEGRKSRSLRRLDSNEIKLPRIGLVPLGVGKDIF